MRCLSVRQPWAWAICAGQKRIENRTWDTPHRGQIVIHAGSSKDSVNAVRKNIAPRKLDESLFPLGAIVGVAELVDCKLLDESLEDDPWAFGPVCWVLENARFVSDPIPMKGKLNLFELPSGVAAAVESQLTRSPPALDEALVEQLVADIRPTLIERREGQMNSYFEYGLWPNLKKLCTRYLLEQPDSFSAYCSRAMALNGLGEYAAAMGDATRAIEMAPQEPAPRISRAFAQFRLRDAAAARADWERAKDLGAEIEGFEIGMQGMADVFESLHKDSGE